ncbi:hypothetical protein EMCRGX_G006879 [Ephydatia muelleri]
MAATLRQQSVNWCPSTHACVEFFDGKKSAVPLSCISTSESGKSVRVGDEVEVKWTDGKKYTAAVTALGGRKQMDAVLATLSSDEALSDDEKEGEERPKSQSEVDKDGELTDDTGCWLGDPNGEQVWIEGADQGKVLASEFISDTPAKLAVHLMTVLFTETQLQTGNCTPTPSGRPLLDQRTINGIRLHVQYKYPEVDPHVWKHIIQVNMNSKCRTLRASAKKSSAASTVKPGV